MHYVGDDTHLDIERYHLEVACRGFLVVGTGHWLGQAGQQQSCRN